MAFITTIGNEKGGVLKSTTVLHLADHIVKDEGKSVAVLDLDTQGSKFGTILKFYQGNDPENPKRDDYHHAGTTASLLSDSPLNINIDPSKVNVFSGGAGLADYDPLTLEQCLSRMKKIRDIDVDYIIIDLPPTTSVRVVIAIGLCDGIFIPTNFTRQANDGVDDIVHKIKVVRNHPAIKSKVMPLGVIPTLIDNRNKTQKNRFAEFLGKYGNKLVLKNFIAFRPMVQNAVDDHMLIYDVKTGDPRRQKAEMKNVVSEMFNKILAFREGV